MREDPKRKGLLFAGTERAGYVSFDDGASWQTLRLNMAVSSVRDLIVKNDDLVAATHGRGFWILDDITPLRQLEPSSADRDAILFAPTTGWRVRWNTSVDMPWPKEEPTAPNPPDGVTINRASACARTRRAHLTCAPDVRTSRAHLMCAPDVSTRREHLT